MGSILEFSGLNIKLLIPITNGFVHAILAINEMGTDYSRFPFMRSFMTSLGMLIAIIPYLIIKSNFLTSKQLLEQKHKKEDQENQTELFNIMPDSKTSSISFEGANNYGENSRKNTLKIDYIYNEAALNVSQSSILTTIFLIIIDFIQTILAVTFLYGNNEYSSKIDLWPFQIISLCIFSKLIANTDIYKHQFFSISIICILGFFITKLEFNKDFDSTVFILILGLLLKDLITSIVLSIIKKLIYINYVSPYKLCAVIGLMELVPNLLGAAISMLFKGKKQIYRRICIDNNENECYFDNLIYFFIQFKDKDWKYYINFTASIILSGLYNILTMLTVGYFSPSHCLITIIIKYIILFFKDGRIDGIEDIHIFGISCSYIILFLYFLILIVLLIYYEIIILKFCGLNYETKKNIIKRSIKDKNFDLNEEKGDTVSSLSSDHEDMD